MRVALRDRFTPAKVVAWKCRGAKKNNKKNKQKNKTKQTKQKKTFRLPENMNISSRGYEYENTTFIVGKVGGQRSLIMGHS